MMREQIQQIINRLQEAAQKLNQSNNLMHETLHGIADDLESAIRPQWVPVWERLPETTRSVFVIGQNEDGYSIGYYLGGYGWGGCDIYDENVTHWHEIDYPEPPEATPQ